MTEVNSIGSYSEYTSKTSNNSELGKDAFLEMLIAQLKNQDPLNPMEGTDFTAQLAQFSSLEQLANINENLDTFSSQEEAARSLDSVSFIGKEVRAQGNSFYVDGKTGEITFNASNALSKGVISIYNKEGELEEIIDVVNLPAGDNSILWNCGSLPAGDYTYEVYAEDEGGSPVVLDTFIAGRVTEVIFKEDGPYLTVDGQSVSLGSIISVGACGDDQDA